MANIIINEKKRTIEMSKKDYTSACNTISRLKYRQNPFPARDAFNDSRGQIFDCKT